ncbi:uncharacterized protein DEA37_0003770 [Paragonimus westermani]|uniref:Uncharacterized protein n=1 Tax=Paragonimus westermani TaxID=34504 RepID=A0A5J4N7V6_9TREM|nr:uncharacterized protein DEA37_0003770 [Paragonimus westermani]
MLWDLTANKYLYTLNSGGVINSLCFSPNRYWLCAAVGPSIKIWDLENKVLADELKPEPVLSQLHVTVCGVVAQRNYERSERAGAWS